jgi:hypothetical protein
MVRKYRKKSEKTPIIQKIEPKVQKTEQTIELPLEPVPAVKKDSIWTLIRKTFKTSLPYVKYIEITYWLFSSQSILDDLSLSDARSSGVIKQKGPHCRFDDAIIWTTDRLVNGLLLFIPVGYFFGYEYGLLLLAALSLGHFMFFDVLDQIVKTIKG